MARLGDAVRRAFAARPRRHLHAFRPDWLTPDSERCWCGATPIPEPTMTDTPDIPVYQQIADAQATHHHAADLFQQASGAAHTARGAYEVARAADPAGQLTDDARHAWVEAAHDEVDARAALEKAADELTALHRQTATYAVMEEGGRG